MNELTAVAQSLERIAASLERLVNLQDAPAEVTRLHEVMATLERRINEVEGRIEHLEDVLQAHQERPVSWPPLFGE